MSTELFQRTKPHINVGTIGHSGHGKTTLSAAILKVQAKQNLAKALSYAEIANGGEVVDATKTITIPLAYLEYQSTNRHYAHIDCPGLPVYIKNLYSGVAQMDAGILVVDTSKGIEAQTLEHVILARQAGVRSWVVFLNLSDVPGALSLDELEVNIRNLLTTWKFDGDSVPVIRGSALRALQGDPTHEQRITQLINSLDSYITVPVRRLDQPFWMGIANSFQAQNGQVVVVGRINRGTVKQGDAVEVLGGFDIQKAIVDDIQTFGKVLDRGEAGDILACRLRDIAFQNITGDLVKAGSCVPHFVFNAQIALLRTLDGGSDELIYSGDEAQFYIGTTVVAGDLNLPSGGSSYAFPGDTISGEVYLTSPVYFPEGMSFAMRQESEEATRTLGTGVIAKAIN